MAYSFDSLNQLKTLVNLLEDSALLFDTDSQILHFNLTAREFFGESLSSCDVNITFRNHIFLDLDRQIVSPELWPTAHILRGETVHEWKGFVFDLKTHLYHSVNCSGSLLSDSVGILKIRELTGHRRIEMKLENFVKQRRATKSLFENILRAEASSKFFFKILENAISFVPNVQAGSILLLKEDNRYHFAAVQGYDLEELQYVTFDIRELLFYMPTEEGSYIIQNFNEIDRKMLDLERYQILRTAGSVEKIKSSLMIPVRQSNQLLATILLDNFDSTNAFDESALMCAEMYGVAVELTLNRIKEQEQLREFERRLLYIFQSSPAASLLVDLDSHNVVEINGAFTELARLSRSEILGSNLEVLGLFDKVWCERVIPSLKKMQSVPPTEIALKSVNTCRKKCLIAAEPLELSDRRYGLVSLADITTQMLTEEELAHALREALQDNELFVQNFLENLAFVRCVEKTDQGPLLPSIDDLTLQEQKVLGFIAAGYENARIASTLGLKLTTVRNYVGRIYQKIGVHSRAEAVIWARKRAILHADEKE